MIWKLNGQEIKEKVKRSLKIKAGDHLEDRMRKNKFQNPLKGLEKNRNPWATPRLQKSNIRSIWM